MLFYKGDEGRPKAEVAGERLKLINPFVEIEVYFKKIQELSMDIYRSCDVIIACLDNVKARIDLNRICIDLKKPMVEGGTVGQEGHVQVIIPEGSVDRLGNSIEFGNMNAVVQSLIDEKLWELDEDLNADYFEAQKEIIKLEEQIELIREKRINSVIENIRKDVEKEINENYDQYFNFTPCYRCAVPVPPPSGKMAAACTLKGIPRNRPQCALKSEVIFYNKYDREVNYSKMEDVKELAVIANSELKSLWKRVLEENISDDEKNSITKDELIERGRNIETVFGPLFSPEDMENIIGYKIPAVQTVSSIIASLESQEALKLIFLMHGIKVGDIMNPSYINYNGVYGQFDQIPINRRKQCVACGESEGIENLSIIIPKNSTFQQLFDLIASQGYKLEPEKWSITNSLTKNFIYLPSSPKSSGLLDHVYEKGIESGNFYKFAAAPSNAIDGIHIFNILIELTE